MNRAQAIEVLGLHTCPAASLTPNDIKIAYRIKAAETHPDTGGDALLFVRVNDAYRFLKKHGTIATGLHIGRTPIEDAREELSQFARDLFAQRRHGKRYKKSQPLEGTFQTDVVRCLELHGAWTFNVHGHVYQKRGVPDMHCAHPFWTGWLELKVEDRKVKDLQRLIIEKLLDSGTPALVLRFRKGSGDWGEPGIVAQYETQLEIVHLDIFPMSLWDSERCKARSRAFLRFLCSSTRELAIWRQGRRVGIYGKDGTVGVEQYPDMDVYA